jgi:hypothetical protein
MTKDRSLDLQVFTSALQVYASRAEVQRLSTGSHRLDQLLGGVEPTRFYLLYGDSDEKIQDSFLYKLMVETLKQSGHIVFLLCGNYRRDRTTLDTEMLLDLLEAAGFEVEEALSRIHIIGVFSEAQLMNAPSLVQELMQSHEVKLVAVQQISKLFYSKTAIGFEDRTEFSGVVSRLKELCSVYDAVLAASSAAKKRRGLSPEPLGGSYFRHAVNVMVYLREMNGGDVSAQLVKHFDKRRVGKRVNLGGEEVDVLGRITKDSMRGRLQQEMRHLKSGYRDALKDNDMQTAFDAVWGDWNNEQGAMIYAQVVSALDLLNLTGVLANRREITELRARLESLEQRYER